ncbi:unnamed protein product [Alopecurus aequalis]
MFAMEALIPEVLGDLAGRAISFVFEKCREHRTVEQDLQRLHQLLLRISTVVEEAEARHVANRAMVRQVSTMRDQMSKGYYLLDAFRCREKKTDHAEVSRSSFAQSKLNPAKRIRRLVSDTTIEAMIIGRESDKELKQLVLVLESMVDDLKEFAIFLMSYPRMNRQPYGAYLYVEKYMFGRQMEREQAIRFLLQDKPLGGGNLGVLPIVGPGLIGKSTFVEHVCDDERVRNHFSLILQYSGKDLEDEMVTNFRDHCVIKYQNIASGEKRSLVIVELLGDVDEGAWRRLLHTSERCMAHGSKIIITSRSEKMVSAGTTEAIKLNCLPKEAFWYFFKVLVFGSTDPEERPQLTSVAMELAHEMRGSFIYANCVATLLRENRSARFWCRVLKQFREFTQKNTLVFGEYPEDHRPRYIWSIAETQQGSEHSKLFLLQDSYQKDRAASGEVPRITVVDLLSKSWSAMPHGKFEILCWRSLIPPYYSYIEACEFVRHKNTTS